MTDRHTLKSLGQWLKSELSRMSIKSMIAIINEAKDLSGQISYLMAKRQSEVHYRKSAKDCDAVVKCFKKIALSKENGDVIVKR